MAEPAPASASPPTTVGFQPDREVRIGLVMYGGVSLAVYINGVAQELLALVRATAPAVDPTTGEPTEVLHLGTSALAPVERVYRELGQLLEQDDPDLDLAAAPVRSRFVVDIISGSSAGGINGVYLAKALANQQDMAALKDLWIDHAGIGDILNDRKGRATVKDRIPAKEPADALFSGDVMYTQLLQAIEGMDQTTSVAPEATALASAGGVGLVGGAPPSPYVRDLDLWITATDLAGLALPLQLGDETIREVQHRQTFHFSFGQTQWAGGASGPGAGGLRINDFAAELNPILAFAARATSSFPLAFAPARLLDIGRVRGADGRFLLPSDGRWRRWFAPYAAFVDPGYEAVAFGDGGDIDNKPFSWVTDTLSARTSSSPVDRRIFYVEPDPGDPRTPTHAAPTPDVVGSTIAAVSLGRVENIREDLDRLDRRKASAERIATAVDAVDRQYVRQGFLASEALATSTADWLGEQPSAMAARGLPYSAYFALRVESLVSEFARSLAQVPWHAADTPTSRAARLLVARWVESTYADPFVVADTAATPTTKRLLLDFDISFRIRRLAFVAARADALASEAVGGVPDTPDAGGGTPAGSLIAGLAASDADPFRAEVRIIKAALGAAEERLRWFVPALRSARDTTAPEPPDVLGEGDRFDLSSAEVDELLDGGIDAFWTRHGPAFTAWCERLGAALGQLVFPGARTVVDDVLAPDPVVAEPVAKARLVVRNYYDRYADFDQVTFPAQTVAGITGEIDPVRVHRFSPRDAPSLVAPIDPATGAAVSKVAGARLGHFGGFLDARWRANDIMWGRLDGAERILATLLGDDPRRPALLVRVQDAILQEEWFASGRPGEGTIALADLDADDDAARAARRAAFVARYQVPGWPPSKELMALGGRTVQVANRVTEGLADRPGASLVHRVTGVIGWVLTSLAAIGFPGRFKGALGRTAAALVMAVGLVLTVVSIPFGWKSGASTGATLVVVGLVLLLLALFARLVVSRPKRLLTWLPALLAIPLAGYGAWQFWTDVLSQHQPFR